MKKAIGLFSMFMIAAAVATAQQKPPAPKVETVKFPPPKVVKDTNVFGKMEQEPKVEQVKFPAPTVVKNTNVKRKTKREPKVEQVIFAKPQKTPSTKPETIPNQ